MSNDKRSNQDEKLRLAIFDVDDTLVSGQSLDLFFKFALHRRASSSRRVFALLAIALSRLFGWSASLRQQIKYIALWGISSRDIQSMFSAYVASSMLARINVSVADRLQSHLNNGDTVVLASASFQGIVDLLAKHLKVEYVLASKTREILGCFLGFRDYCYAKKKIDAVLALFPTNQVDWTNSWMYSDHISDLPLFEKVGRRVVVTDASRSSHKLSWVPNDWEVIELHG